MYFREYTPSPHLFPFIKSYIIIEDEEGEIRNQAMNIYPSGHLEMIVSYGDEVIFSKDGFRLRGGAGYLGGQILEPVFYRCLGRLKVLSIIFRPYGIYRFLDIPQMEFNNKRIELELFMGAGVREFIGRLCDEPTREGKVAITDRFFGDLLILKTFRAAHIARASGFIKGFQGTDSLMALCRSLDISIKTMERDFRRIVGLTPKELSRVLRFNRAYNGINSGEYRDVHELITDCGYYDQAHCINEFRRFTLCTPGDFFSMRGETVERSFREVVKI